jgi:hypothetical protein
MKSVLIRTTCARVNLFPTSHAASKYPLSKVMINAVVGVVEDYTVLAKSANSYSVKVIFISLLLDFNKDRLNARF